MFFKVNFKNRFLVNLSEVSLGFKKGLKKIQKNLAESEIVDDIEDDIRSILLRLNVRFHKAFPYFGVLNLFFDNKSQKYRFAAVADIVLIALIAVNSIGPAQRMIIPLISPMQTLHPLTNNEAKNTKEVFGFAPQWTFNKLDNVDFSVLTTLAYFGVDLDGQGNLDRDSDFYQTFKSQYATDMFKKAHAHGTRVVLTLTQMRNEEIRALMDDPEAQNRAINDVVAEVKNRGIDGINVDFEYSGNPGQDYRDKFSKFIADLTTKMHSEVPDSKVSVSVYASAIKEPKIYDIAKLGKLDINIFMMAYDFGYAGSDQVIPTAPLYGYKDGTYWYDVATAVDDFVAQMPSGKLILGTPWYGYNYAIYGQPQVKATTYTRGQAETYKVVTDEIKPDGDGISYYQEGWDDKGKVSWKSYYSSQLGAYRMVFIEDQRSLSYKYDFAKSHNLGGVGIWALGFDEGKHDMWALLKEKFGSKDLANNAVLAKEIH